MRTRAEDRICRIVFLFLSVVIVGMLTGCGGMASPVASTPTTPGPAATPPSNPAPPSTPSGTLPTLPVNWSPTTSPLPAPPEVQPPPQPQTAFPLDVSSPAEGASFNSPIRVAATSTPSNPILYTRVYIDGQSVFLSFHAAIDTRIWTNPGAHTLEILAVDKTGQYSATVRHVNVSASPTSVVGNIQNLPGWESCSAVFPPDSARAGQICAAGLGTAVSTMIPGQSSPSLSGSSAKFTMGGPTGYSNMLYFNLVGGSNTATHFVYDLYFLIDNPTASQALEFDVNQTFGGLRWTWGTECNFNGSGKWDIWDPLHGQWIPTYVDCKPFPANQWIHLVWDLARSNGQTLYKSVTINGTTYPLNITYAPQLNWTWEEIDVAFQMDGDFRQDPYNVWLDKVTLTVE